MIEEDSGKKHSEDSELHKKHERLTELVYNNPDMLPNRYVFIVTNLCNLNCSFCFMKRNYRENSMNKDEWINLAKQLPEYARVTITGGEPLMFPDFEEVFRYVAERFDCNIITNGLLLTEEIIDLLLSYPKFRVLSISIDDVGNKIRGVKPDQWQYLEKMLKYFVEKRDELNSDCKLDIKTMILDENAEQLFELRKYCVEKLKCDFQAFQFLKGSPLQHSDVIFDFEKATEKSKAQKYEKFDLIKEQLDKIRKYNVENNKVSFLHPKVASMVSEKPIPDISCMNNIDYIKEDYLPCKYPWSSVHINVDGALFSCLAVPIGNVKRDKLKDVIHGEGMQRFRKLIKEKDTIEGCNRCGWLKPVKYEE